jgi:F-type H+-transporting ATPase subunit b
LDNAKRYDEKLKELAVERQNVLAKADREAQKILVLADEEAKRMGAEGRAEADRLAAETIARASREIEQAKKEMIGDIRRQAADLVVLAAEKVIHERLDGNKDRELIQRALKEID